MNKKSKPGSNYTSHDRVINFISKSAKIGKNFKIWHFSYVGDNTEIGNDVSVGSLVHIDYNVKIGDNSRIEGSVYIPPLTVIGKNVFIGPCATFTNDPYPMSPKMIGVVVEDGAILGGQVGIGEKATVGPGVILGGGAGVLSNKKLYGANQVFWGRPAQPLKQYLRDLAKLRKD